MFSSFSFLKLWLRSQCTIPYLHCAGNALISEMLENITYFSKKVMA